MLKQTIAFCLFIFFYASFIGCNISEDEKNNNQDISSEDSTVVISEKILDSIDKDTVNLAKHILSSDINLAEIEKEYGEIVEVDWIDGALYRHKNLNLWIAYSFDESFVVSFDEGAYIREKNFEMIDYNNKARSYTILEDAKKSFPLYLKCNLSDLFNEVESLNKEEFTQFAKINTTELRDTEEVVFDYNELTVKIFCCDEDILSGDYTVIISNLTVSSE